MQCYDVYPGGVGVEFMLWQVRNPDEPPLKEGETPPAQSKKAALTPKKAKRAAAMRDLLVKLGPAFVKIGQALSRCAARHCHVASYTHVYFLSV